LVANAEPNSLEIQVRQCSEGYMAWVSGLHQIFAVGRSPLEAIGALVSENKDLFDVRRINFR
jgi:hypothetical protein